MVTEGSPCKEDKAREWERKRVRLYLIDIQWVKAHKDVCRWTAVARPMTPHHYPQGAQPF